MFGIKKKVLRVKVELSEEKNQKNHQKVKEMRLNVINAMTNNKIIIFVDEVMFPARTTMKNAWS